jgi:multiple sugar transport system permease protein/raffinose/stachyose/melibiose transport system permease protein
MSRPALPASLSRRLAQAPNLVLVGLFAAFSLFPVAWMISTSLKGPDEIYHASDWLPHAVTLANFKRVLWDPHVLRSFGNSLLIATGSTLAALLVGIFSGYGFARFDFPGKHLLFVSVLAGQILPLAALVIPFFIQLRTYGLLNTFPGVIAVYTVVSTPLAVWLLKGFFEAIPREVEEAAIVDGCSHLGVLFRVVMPIAAPAIFAVGMYAFVVGWNEFLLGLVLTTDLKTRPIAVSLALYRTEWGIEWGALMAACLVMAVPAMAIFLYFEKHLVRGLAEGAVKG